SFRTGLTAVQAHTCTRQAVFDALRARRCYATSGAKILLDFTVNGMPMGSNCAFDREAFARVEVIGTDVVARLELIGPSGPVASSKPNEREAVLQTEISEMPWIYARVTQQDGEMAWSSPVFFDL